MYFNFVSNGAGNCPRYSRKDYLLFIFKNREVIAVDPTQYTPYAYALKLDAAKN